MYNSAFFGNHYKIIKKIGQGGSASVYLCKDTHIGKMWAVKLFKKAGADISNIKSEISLLKSLDYYLFPRISDAFSENGHIGIVTDYIQGTTMKQYLSDEGALPVGRAVNYYEQLLKAIIYLHSMDTPILYLDMKPENIMVRPDGEIRLIDFGIARSILLKNKSYGTIGYSPPEQYQYKEELTKKADIFALGMTLYAMVTAKTPCADLYEMRKRIRHDTLIPAFIKKIILRSTHPNPNMRWDSGQIVDYMHKKRTVRGGLISVAIIAALVCAVFTSMIFFGINAVRKYESRAYAKKMLSEAAEHFEDGHYTKEGLKIICGYIDGNFLDEDAKQYFCYEVAKNYFNVQKDFATAKVYFEKLDKERFDDVGYYIDICRKMTSFNDSDEKLKELFLSEIKIKEGGDENNG